MSDAWSCDRWGRLSGDLAGIPDPFCSCSMCVRYRSFVSKPKKKAK